MRIVFIGTVDFSRHCLTEVLAQGGDVVGVFTLDRRDAGFNSDFAPVADLAEKHGVPVHLVKNINDKVNVDLIRILKPDVVFVFGWSQIISKDILEIPPLGCIGTHPALLPRNRGRHPIVWALVEGLDESGLTFFYLDDKADSGDILWQKAFPITLEDDAASVYLSIKKLASDAIREFLPLLRNGTAPRRPQDQSRATYWRRRKVEDGEIHWDESTTTTFNLIRALTRPYVAAHTFSNGKKLLIWKAALPVKPTPAATLEIPAGKVFAEEAGRFHVRTGDAHLLVDEFEAVEGEGLEIGARLGGPL